MCFKESHLCGLLCLRSVLVVTLCKNTCILIGGPWLSGRVLASGPVGPGIHTPPGHG